MANTLADQAALAGPGVRRRSRHDSAFFAAIAALLAITAFAGFAPSLVPRSHLAGEPGLSPLLVVHASVFVAWLILYLVQVALVASRAIRWHRRLGIAGCVLAASMVVTALAVQIEHTRHVVMSGAYARNRIVEDLGLSLGVLDIAVFAVFVSAAIWLRHRPDQHKRLLLFATIAIIGPAVVKFPSITALHPIAVVLSPLAFSIPLPLYDLMTRGRLMSATVWGLTLSVAYHILAMALAGAGVANQVVRGLSS